ncbi:Y-family DNA polymerase, partial [Alloalcanivorax gelatiniphagus]
DLEVREADEPAREAALRRQGQHLLALTPQVCTAPPSTLLLEVGGCLKLYGGFQGLMARVDRYRLHCPLTTRLGLGPTPLAAWHLTDPPPLEQVPEPARFQAWLAELELDRLDLEPRLRERLRAPGFRTLGELYPLPRPALGKRFGAGFLDWLQRLLGEKPDPRRPLPPPRPFRERLDFDDPLDNLDYLHGPMTRLLARLSSDLERHQESLTAIRWHLYLNNGHRDTLVVRRAQAGHDAATWLDLTRRRLEHQVLEAPVLGLGLDGGRPRPRNPALADLFP